MTSISNIVESIASKTISGRPLDTDNPFDFFILAQQRTIFNALLTLGYRPETIKGISNIVIGIYRKIGLTEWGHGEQSLLLTIEDLLIYDNKSLGDRNKKETEDDAFSLKLCCALFCYDRAISRAKKKRIAESTRWLESALEQDFFIPQILSQKNIALSEKGKVAVRKKLANDPKQKALLEIEQHYQAKKSKFKIRGFSAQFIRDMWAQYPVIESQKTIENLVSALNKQNENIPR